MIALIQRVSYASVTVEGKKIANIKSGLLVLLGVEKTDSESNAEKLFNKIINYRVFEDEAGKMNLSLNDTQGELLIVPQFTLAANTQSGLRPSFSSAAPPIEAERGFDYMQKHSLALFGGVQFGEFGVDMKVELLNDGPVTFWLQC